MDDHDPVSDSGASSSFGATDSDNEIPGNNPPSPPEQQGGNKRKLSSDEDISIMGSSTSTKRHQTEDQDTAISIPMTNEDRLLLVDIQDFYEETGYYPFSNEDHLQEFYDQWVNNVRVGVYANVAELKSKMDDLESRFLDNVEKERNGEDVKDGMGRDEIRIFCLSKRIWGMKDSTEEDTNGDDDQSTEGKDSKDLSSKGNGDSCEEKSVDENNGANPSDSGDSSQQETSDDQTNSKVSKEIGRVSPNGSKDSSKQESCGHQSDSKDSSSKNLKESPKQETSGDQSDNKHS